jgi:hypothetical protein
MDSSVILPMMPLPRTIRFGNRPPSIMSPFILKVLMSIKASTDLPMSLPFMSKTSLPKRRECSVF